MSDDASTLAQWIAEAHDIVFFGGAGVSTESGIPDFRGAKGFYHQEREIPLERVLSIDFFSACPGAYYAWFAEQTAREGVAPNAAHRFLAGLERAGKLKAVVTQNIDGLHQAAGSKRVLELHGNWTRLECTGCGARSTIDDFDEARAGRVPHCPSCSAVVRPDIVFYGEALDPATLEGAVLAIAGGGHADRGRHVVGGLPGGRAHRLLPGRAPRPHERDAHPLRRARRPDHPRAHRPRLRADPGARVSRRHSAARVSGGVRQFRTRCPQR